RRKSITVAGLSAIPGTLLHVRGSNRTWSCQSLLEGLVAAGGGGNGRDMTLADRVYLCRVIGGVHEIVEGHDTR
ncbi:MAG: hypothetical protein OXE76_11580, partial [Alphaproteobacteria bacterium]|nr:hypothetical protein [Alphaproteobacteria bacterium]